MCLPSAGVGDTEAALISKVRSRERYHLQSQQDLRKTGHMWKHQEHKQPRPRHWCAHGCPHCLTGFPPFKAWQRQGQQWSGASNAGFARPRAGTPDSPPLLPKTLLCRKDNKLIKITFLAWIENLPALYPGESTAERHSAS